MNLPVPRAALLVVALAVACGASPATVVAAAQNPSTPVLRACVKKTSGAMRVLLKGTKCRKRERLVTWRLAGPEGPAGPAGPAGAPGPAGTAGAQGPAGASAPATGAAAGGVLTGTYPNPGIANGVIGAAALASPLFDALAGTPSLRSLGTGERQAAAGNDARLSDARAPKGAAAGDLTGTYPAPTIGANAVAGAELAPTLDDAAAGTPSLRTLGTGAQQAASGDDARLSDARVPLDGSVTDAKLAPSVGVSAVSDLSTAATLDVPSLVAHACAGYTMGPGEINVGSLVTFYPPDSYPGAVVIQARRATIDDSLTFFVCNTGGSTVDPPAASISILISH